MVKSGLPYTRLPGPGSPSHSSVAEAEEEAVLEGREPGGGGSWSGGARRQREQRDEAAAACVRKS